MDTSSSEVGTFHFIDCSSLPVSCELTPGITEESESVLVDPLNTENIKIETDKDGPRQVNDETCFVDFPIDIDEDIDSKNILKVEHGPEQAQLVADLEGEEGDVGTSNTFALTTVARSELTASVLCASLPEPGHIDIMREEAELISEANSASGSRTPRRIVPAPQKKMKTSVIPPAGKRIPLGNKHCVAESDEEEDDQGRQNSVTSDGEQSAAQSDKGSERVYSPVLAKSSGKKKRMRASRSRSTSSSGSSTDNSRRSSVQKKRKKNKDTKTDKRVGHKSHSTVRSVSRSPTKSESKPNKDKKTEHNSQSPLRSVSRSPARSASKPETPHDIRKINSTSLRNNNDSDINENQLMLPPQMEHTNHLYSTIMNNKSRNSYPQKLDSMSRSTVRSKPRGSVEKKKPPLQQHSIDVDELAEILREEVRETKLSKETIKLTVMLHNNGSLSSRRNNIKEALQYINFHNITPYDTARENGLPRIDWKAYLFSAQKDAFSYKYDALLETSLSHSSQRLHRTLFHALGPLSAVEELNPDSLDLVFRKSLKELASDITTFEDVSPNNIDNPMFVSACHLELSLLKKIREHYKTKFNEDIIEFFFRAFIDDFILVNVVQNSLCEVYLRKLCDRYAKSVALFDEALNDSQGIKSMRVWTSLVNQAATNIVFGNYLVTVYADMINPFDAVDFSEEYSKRMRPFMNNHMEFLTETLQASELMAWMCFGVTLDNSDIGLMNMAHSYFEVQNQLCDFKDMNPTICWNYALASRFRRAF